MKIQHNMYEYRHHSESRWLATPKRWLSHDKPIHQYMFPKIWVPQNGWLKMENPLKMDDLGVPLFSETSIRIYIYTYIYIYQKYKDNIHTQHTSPAMA